MVIKVKKNGSFEIIPRATLQDERLIMDELGLLCRLLSNPHDWEIRPGQLKKMTGWGKDKLRRVLDKLQVCGYLRRKKERKKNGSYRWTCELYGESQGIDYKKLFKKEQNKKEPNTDNPHVEPPCAGRPTVDDPPMSESTDDSPAPLYKTDLGHKTDLKKNKQQTSGVDDYSDQISDELLEEYVQLTEDTGTNIDNPPGFKNYLTNKKSLGEIKKEIEKMKTLLGQRRANEHKTTNNQDQDSDQGGEHEQHQERNKRPASQPTLLGGGTREPSFMH